MSNNAHTVKLTVQEVATMRTLLQYEGKVGADGKPVARTYTPAERSAMRWFFKNTDAIVDEYKDKVSGKRKDIEDTYKEEKADEEEMIRKLKKELAEADENSNELRDAIHNTYKVLGEAQSVDGKVNKELNEDQELVSAYQNEEHDVEVRDNTYHLLQSVLNEPVESNVADVAATIYDKLNPESDA